jgi:ABC-type bacteriocin/lantibiotic exporter with double-glycine peptidase domain
VKRLLVALVLLSAGCSPFGRTVQDPASAGFRTVSGVPFRTQEERDDCGPAALASLLAHRGREVPVPEIRQAVYSPVLRGTLLADMENYARSLGFVPRSGRGTLEFLRKEVEAGRPVVVPIQAGSLGISRPHYLVVYGYSRDRFLVHAGTEGSVTVAASDFLSRWERMNRLYLLLE